MSVLRPVWRPSTRELVTLEYYRVRSTSSTGEKAGGQAKALEGVGRDALDKERPNPANMLFMRPLLTVTPM